MSSKRKTTSSEDNDTETHKRSCTSSTSEPLRLQPPATTPSRRLQPLLEHFRVDDAWIDQAPSPVVNPELDNRLASAFDNLHHPKGAENLKQSLKDLLTFGLVAQIQKPTSSAFSLVHYIVHFLNKLLSPQEDLHPDHSFSFLSMPEVVRTKLFFHFIAFLLHVNIILFSTQSKSHAFRAEDATSSIGILHHVDSFYGRSEYLALGMSQTSPSSSSTRASSQPVQSIPATAPATFRTEDRVSTRRRFSDNVTVEEATVALRKACSRRLLAMAESSIGDLSKSKKSITDHALERKRLALWEDVIERDKVPKGTNPIVIEILREEYGLGQEFDARRLESKLRDVKTGKIWKKVVETEFDGLWDAALTKQSSKGSSSTTAEKKNVKKEAKNKEKEKDNNDNEKEACDDKDEDEEVGGNEKTQESKDGLQVFTRTLKQILRPDLMEDYERIVTMLNRAQVDVSNDMTELSILIQKTVLQIASGKVYEGTQWAPDHTHFDLQDLLPEGFLPRDTSVNTLINVAPIPLHLPDELKKYTKQKAVATPESNVAHLLSINHLQLLHARELGNGKQLGKEHTIWENCIRNIQDLAPPREPDDPTPPVKAPEGLSRTVSGAIVELTTAVGNIWNGAAYRKLLDYLVRILLRIHLAPNREKNSQKKGSIVKVKDQKPDNSSSEQKPDDSNSEQKPGQETTSEKKPKIRDLTRKHWLYKFKGLCNTLSDELERVDDDRFERKSGQIMMLLSTLEGQRTTGQQHHLARLDVRLKELTGSSHARTADPDDEKVGQGDIDKTLGKVAGGLKTNEPSDSQLTALGSILKKLLESPDGLDCGKEWIQQQSFQGTKFTDAECDIVLKLGKLLWPYVPPKGSIPHVCLRAPLAFIANSFLRMTGYKKFTRELSPTISASAVHALGLNAAGLYETLCAGSKNHYDVKDAFGHPLTDASKVTTPAENKRAVFEAFFDMAAVDKLCDTYGLRFHNRMVYVDRYTVRIVGDTIAHGGFLLDGSKRTGYPVVSQYDLRKKSKKYDRSTNPWTREFYAQQLSAEQISEKAAELSAAKAIAEEDIKEARRKTQDLQCTQTELRQAVNAVQYPDRLATETYEKLRNNRETLRSARLELNQQEENLGQLKREHYFFNKLDKADKSSPPKVLESNCTMTTPTWDRFTVEDDVKYLDIEKLATSEGRSIVFSGTDYGISTMSQTVALSMSQVSEYFSYYSTSVPRGQGTKELVEPTDIPMTPQEPPETHTMEPTDIPMTPQEPPETHTMEPTDIPMVSQEPPENQPMDLEPDEPSPNKPKVSRVPRSHSITAENVNEISHMNKIAKRRRTRLNDTTVKGALKAISDPTKSLKRAVTMKEVDEAHHIRSEHRKTLQGFETTNARLKDQQTQRLRTNQAWKKLGSAERHYVQEAGREQSDLPPTVPPTISPIDGFCSECQRHHVPNTFDQDFAYSTQCPHLEPQTLLPVMITGLAGTGVGSRIGGHTRRGGKKLRHEHQQHCVVALTDEFRTSKVCIYCFHQVQQARSRRLINGEIKTVRVHGALECTNPACPSFQEGYTIKPRDPHAAVAIALAGISALSNPQRQPIAPFSRNFVRAEGHGSLVV